MSVCPAAPPPQDMITLQPCSKRYEFAVIETLISMKNANFKNPISQHLLKH